MVALARKRLALKVSENARLSFPRTRREFIRADGHGETKEVVEEKTEDTSEEKEEETTEEKKE